jgi:hypothetical protein
MSNDDLYGASFGIILSLGFCAAIVWHLCMAARTGLVFRTHKRPFRGDPYVAWRESASDFLISVLTWILIALVSGGFASFLVIRVLIPALRNFR